MPSKSEHEARTNEQPAEQPADNAVAPAAGLAPEAPLLGQRVIVTITDIAFGGEGVGRWNGFVVFVPFVALGEEVEAEVIDPRKHFARTRLLRVIKPAADRVQPRCPYYGACGGCQYQHLDYASQLRVKHKQIADLFERVGGFPSGSVSEVVPCPSPYGYRNRLMLRSQWNKPEQRLSIGFLRQESRLVVDVEECPIAEPEVSAGIRQVLANPPPKGGIKMVLRKMPEGWEVPRDSFFQNNFLLLPGLVRTVRAQLQSAGTRFLADIYCGVGFFAIELADLVTRYVGVEIDLQAIRAARRNAENRKRPNGEFRAAAAEQAIGELLHGLPPAETTVILDPPRVGCAQKLLQQIREYRPRQVLYVSCHPATLARDIKSLCKDGLYELKEVRPLDMFPQTQHVECVADIRATDVAVAPESQPQPQPQPAA